MRVALVSLTAAALALAACQPAPENGTEEQPSLENIAEAEGDEVVAQDAAAPTADATPLASDKASWTIDKTRAAYGPPESEALLSMRCENGALTVQRITAQPLKGSFVANMNFLGEGANTLVRVTNQQSELGGSLWQGEVLDTAQLANVIGTGEPAITVDIEGEDAVLVRPSAEAARFVRACG